MPYTKKDWKRRIAERSDMTSSLVHLTRESSTLGTYETLIKILKEKRLIGSTTQSGFIVGDTPAVCFQDAPVSGIVQNVFYEQKKREANPKYKLRYRAIGLLFPKEYAYQKGARPVIYDRTSEAKQYLPPNQWWRIVNFDLSSDTAIVDWSHEREWRFPGDFTFELAKVTVLLIDDASYRLFIKKGRASYPTLLEEIGGIINLAHVLY